MSEDLLRTLVALATIIGALAAVGTLTAAVTRPARLRREAEVWRQSLDDATGDQRQLLVDLHRDAVAQLISIRLVPAYRFWSAAAVLGAGAGVLGYYGWELGAAVAREPEAGWQNHLVDAAGAYPVGTIWSLVISSGFFGYGAMSLLALHVARRRTWRDAAKAKFPLLYVVPNQEPTVSLHAHEPDETTLGGLLGRFVLLAATGAVVAVGAGALVHTVVRGPLAAETWLPPILALGVSLSGTVLFVSVVGLWALAERPQLSSQIREVHIGRLDRFLDGPEGEDGTAAVREASSGATVSSARSPGERGRLGAAVCSFAAGLLVYRSLRGRVRSRT